MLSNLLDLGAALLTDSRSRKQHAATMDEYRKSRQQAQGQFDAQMDQSIQRRVKDAISAGVHPLFALGASAGAQPTLSAGGPPRGPTGSALGDSMARIADRIGESELNRARAREAEAGATRDHAEAQYLDSRRASLTQDLASRGRDGAGVKTFPYPQPEGPITFGPAEYFNPRVATSKSVGIESGTHPGTIDVKMPDGRTINIPSPNLGLDEVSQVDYVYQRSKHHLADFFTNERARQKELWASIKDALKRFKRKPAAIPPNL